MLKEEIAKEVSFASVSSKPFPGLGKRCGAGKFYVQLIVFRIGSSRRSLSLQSISFGAFQKEALLHTPFQPPAEMLNSLQVNRSGRSSVAKLEEPELRKWSLSRFMSLGPLPLMEEYVWGNRAI